MKIKYKTKKPTIHQTWKAVIQLIIAQGKKEGYVH